MKCEMKQRIVYSVLAIFMSSNIFVVGKKMYVLQSETVTLSCNHQTWDTSPYWSGPGSETTYTSGYQINPRLKNFDRITLITNKTLEIYDLVIKQFSFEDEGIYVCSSLMSDGTIKEENISVHIKNTPTAHIRHGPAINVTEGDMLSLYCNVSSNYEKPTVSWKLANSEGRDFVISNLSTNQYYKSDNMSRTGAGLYICMVTSPGGSAEDNITIEVQYAPEISFTYSKSEGLLKCVTYGVPSQYTFYKWEHKSEFGDHIRYISDDGNGQINISSDLNETYRHHDRGIYVCRVSNGVSVNGKRVQSSEYAITPEGKPYFTTANNPYQQSVFNHNENITIYVVSVPKMSKISIFKPDLSVDVIDHKQLDLTRIKDTMYGKIVSVRGYIISIPVTTRSDVQWCTVEVINSIGSNNYTVYFSFVEGKLTHAAVYIISILLVGLIFILLAVLFYRWKKDDDNGVGDQSTTEPAHESSDQETLELNYVDDSCDPKPKENKTEYVAVNISHSVEPKLPSSDEEEDSDENFENEEGVQR